MNGQLGLEREPSIQGFVKPVTVEAEIYRSGDDLLLNGSLCASLAVSCRRCLDEFERTRERDFDFVIVKTDGGDDRDDEGVAHYVGDEVDLEPLIAEQALLAIEADDDLCAPDCKGLCPGCGVNLNHESCCCGRSSTER